MRIYTSHFGNLNKLNANGIKPISIALYPPKFFNGACLKNVAPTRSILYESKSEADYTERYKKEVLSRINPSIFLKILQDISTCQDVALCCFEKYGDFCHRHILSEWLSEKLNIEVTEFGVNKEPKSEQLSLF